MRISIIGGGITGLTAGYELAKKGYNVVIFEKEKSYGGLVDTIYVHKEPVERFYHHIFTSDTDIIELIKELGLEKELKWYTPKNAIYVNDQLFPFTSPLDLLKFEELTLFERIKLGVMVLRASFIKNWQSLENITAKEWIIKNCGENVYSKLWKPLLNSKFDYDSEHISAVWIWNKFKLRGSSRGKNIGREMLGYMDGSFKRILEKLEQKIIEKGGSLRTETEVTQIIPLTDGRLEVVANDTKEVFDRVIVTVAPSVLSDMIPSLPKSYRKQISNIKYKANICVMIEMSECLSPWYWITVADESFPFVLVIEHTNLVTDGRYKGSILYLSRYLDSNYDIFKMSDNDLIKLFISGLKRVFPNMDESHIKKVHVNKSIFAQPVIPRKYSIMKPNFKTPVKNLFLANMAQIYPEDRGQNYAVCIGKKVASFFD